MNPMHDTNTDVYSRTPHGRVWGTARPCEKPTQEMGTPVVLSEDTHPMLTSPSFPEHMLGQWRMTVSQQ